MTLEQVLPHVESLSRWEKLVLIQRVASGLIEVEAKPPQHPPKYCPVWSPNRAFDAAAAMLKALEGGEQR